MRKNIDYTDLEPLYQQRKAAHDKKWKSPDGSSGMIIPIYSCITNIPVAFILFPVTDILAWGS